MPGTDKQQKLHCKCKNARGNAASISELKQVGARLVLMEKQNLMLCDFGDEMKKTEAAGMQTQPIQRIVSKTEYAGNVGKKAAVSCFGALLLLMSGFCLLVVCATCAIVILAAGRWNTTFVLYVSLIICAMVIGGSGTYLLGRRVIDRANKIDIGVPITPANTADLPAPDSLVRASSEPLQAQEAVLLRAVTAEQDRHTEQLLRAAAGTE